MSLFAEEPTPSISRPFDENKFLDHLVSLLKPGECIGDLTSNRMHEGDAENPPLWFTLLKDNIDHIPDIIVAFFTMRSPLDNFFEGSEQTDKHPFSDDLLLLLFNHCGDSPFVFFPTPFWNIQIQAQRDSLYAHRDTYQEKFQVFFKAIQQFCP